MDNKLKNILKYGLSFGMAFLLLYACFRNVEWADFVSALSSCHWGFIALSMAIGILSILLRAIRWRMLLGPIDKSLGVRVCFNSINIGYIANMLLPRMGELVRCGYITKDSVKGDDGRKLASYDKVVGTVVLERAWDVLSLLICFAIVFVFTWDRFGSFFQDNVIGRITSSLSIPWLLFAMAVAGGAGLVAVWALRDRIGLFGRIWKIIQGIWQGVASCLRMDHGWMFIVLTIGIWACYWMTAATTIWALRGVGPSSEIISSMTMVDALFLMVVGSVSALVPVPGGFGAYHYLVSLALQTVYGIPMSVGIVFATLSHETQALTQMICGAIGYFVETFRK